MEAAMGADATDGAPAAASALLAPSVSVGAADEGALRVRHRMRPSRRAARRRVTTLDQRCLASRLPLVGLRAASRFMKRVVALTELKVGVTSSGDLGSAGAMRSAGNGRPRRLSPYGKKPDAAPSQRQQRKPDTFAQQQPEQQPGLRLGTSDVIDHWADVVKTGPVLRQAAKEAEFKQKGQRAEDRASWWKVASMKDPAQAVADPSTLNLARGRIHARADLASVEQWRLDACEAFLKGHHEASSAVRRSPPRSVITALPEHSPGYYDRRYGGRAPMPPLRSRTRAVVAARSGASSAREAETVAMRRRVFVERQLQSS